MAVLRDLRRQGRQIVFSLLGIMTIAYFAYHAIEGERGLRSYFALKHQSELATATLAELRGKRDTIERRVGSLRPDGLDLDMLEERAHGILGLVHEDEFVVLVDPEDR